MCRYHFIKVHCFFCNRCVPIVVTVYVRGARRACTYTMPRLKIPDEPRQQGYANSVRKDTVKTKKKRKAKQPPPPPLGSDRAIPNRR